MSDMQTAVVIPYGQGRMQNLHAVMDTVAQQTVQPLLAVIVADGPEASAEVHSIAHTFKLPAAILETPKHQPGMEQPRNLGVRLVDDLRKQGDHDERWKSLTHVWFLDSDVIVRPRALEFYTASYNIAEAWRCPECGTPDVNEDPETAHCEKCGFEGGAPNDGWEPAHSIFVGPYDWLPAGVREPMPELRNDPDGVPPPGRWDRFDRHEPDTPVVNDIFAGLACFSGNLVWNIDEFKRVGGFWNELYHGRCEDGELGVRSVAMGVPITFVRDARGWHLDHPRNMDLIRERNAIDVPKLDARHPYLKDEGLFVVDADGKRFNYRCETCGEEMNAALSWGHRASHGQA